MIAVNCSQGTTIFISSRNLSHLSFFLAWARVRKLVCLMVVFLLAAYFIKFVDGKKSFSECPKYGFDKIWLDTVVNK